jgi:gamma-glutamyltranspeptidase/glutathione hydrolase
MTDLLGGDAEIIVYSARDQKVTVYNGTGWAPQKASVDFYLDQGGIPNKGPLSTQLPGGWAGWMLMLQDYGTLPLEKIMEPVIAQAQDSFVDLYSAYVAPTGLAPAESNEALRTHYTPGGNRLTPGTILHNPTLVNTYRSLVNAARQGRTVQDGYRLANDYYYRGPLAQEVVRWSEANGGLFTLADFNEFRAEKQEPLHTDYRGYEVYVCPPNSQGPALIEALNMLENYDLKALGHNSAEYIDLVIQALNLAIQDRNDFYGDQRFVNVPSHLFTKEYAQQRIQDIQQGQAMTEIPNGGRWFDYEGRGRDTTFMYVADQYGNVVASTHSLCNLFGSGWEIESLGFVLNNRMVYFTLDEENPNVLEPRKRSMQTIAPALATRNGRPAFVVGTPGADVQVQGVLQVILNFVEFGMNPQLAVENARMVTVHPAGLMNPVQYPRTIQLDPGVKDEDVLKLDAMGYIIQYIGAVPGAYSGFVGFGQFFENGYMWGGADNRMGSYAVAW